MARHLFTSESVTEGHPDKVADQISDAILDEIIGKDSLARVACETLVTTGLVLIAGEITCKCYVDIPSIVRKTVCDIGYTRAKYGFDCDTCAVLTAIDEQSPDIARGVDLALEAKTAKELNDIFNEIGAGDQGMMIGYATNETEELMPMPIMLAHKIARRLAEVRKNGKLGYLRPDGKTQVSIVYENGRPVSLQTVVVSTQHHPEVAAETYTRDVIDNVIIPVVPSHLLNGKTRFLINPTGRFVLGGPHADTGLTGRKIIVDTYGGLARHGGGAFSGKDPTKVDRSASYAARYVAKNLVAAGLADRCEVHVAYAIGVAHPVSLRVDTFGTGKVDEERLEAIVREVFDLRPAAIIYNLDLRRPLYRQTAAYGHFGRHDLDLPWEKTDKVEVLRALLNGDR
ncbi:MAG: methionine adenosyltransferase [Desulforudis sp.]|nr:methionine adenosyltransferase [Clostridia bacterium]MDQ7792171.1 methionine adenosyltransferase [Clostridia bacterium]RJX21769.1 MAG: methionine adenosyltransferase [Desulforudis sp.]